MSLDDDAESQEVERIHEPEISDQVDDAEISPAVSEAKPILDEVVAMAGLKVARNQLDEKEPEELSLEELEDGVLLQKVLVKQLRADYAVRLERSEVMDRELKELGSDPGILQMKVAEAKRQSEELLALANREAMRAEDGLGRVWRLYQSRSQSQLLAQQLAKRSRSDLEALRRSRGHVEKEVAAEVLSDQRRRIERLKAEAAAQDEKLLSLGADLRSTLDFMVRVNLDARGARRPKELGQLPELQALNLSEVGQGHMAEILKKYEVYLENSRANPEALHRAALRHGLSVPAAQHAAQQMQRQKPLPLPSHEEATESFAEERRLLRARLMDGWRRVAGSGFPEATSLHALVLAHQARDEKTKALQVAEEAADIYKEIGEKGGETSMLQIVSQLHLELSRPDKAFQVAQEVASMDISLHETAVAQETVYEAFLQQGDQEEAMKVAQELVNLCNDRSDGKREAIARLMVANVHYNLKDFTQCILVAREAQVLLHDLGAFVDEAAAVRMVAEAYLANGELPHAVKAAERSLRLLKNKKKDSEEVQSMLVVASVKLQVLVQDKIRAQRGSPSFNVALEDALEAAETAVHFAREKRMKSQLGQALLTQGQAQLAGLRIDDALKSAAEATEVADELGSEREKANVMCLEADIHFTNGNANKALVLVNKALAIFQEYRDSRGEWIAMNILEQITGPPEEPAQQSEWTEEQWAQWNAWQQQQGASGGGGGGVPQGIQKATEEQRVRRRTDAGAKLDVARISTDTVRKRVEEIVRFTADLDDEPIELDQPLMQVGVTSRTAVGLRNMLSEELPGVDLPFTLIFDYPSVASISDHVMDSLGAVG